METNLARELKPYYRREGNRVVFQNGMTLNQLALEMRFKLGWREVDASVLSRVINGHRFLTGRQLEVFCDVLNLTDEQRWRLQIACAEDVSLKQDLKVELALSPDLLTLYTEQLELIRLVKKHGNPHLARDRADRVAQQLREILERNPSSKLFQPLLRIRGWVLLEGAKGSAHIDLQPILLAKTKPVVRETQTIAKECENAELFGSTLHRLGEVYYIVEDYVASIQSLTSALDTVKSVDDQLALMCTLAADWARLGEKNRFEEVEEKIRGLIEGGRFSNIALVCGVLEGLARARKLLDLPRVWETLKQGEEIYASIQGTSERAPLRAIQLARTRLEIRHHYDPTAKRSLEVDGAEALSLAQAFGFQRHAEQIQKILAQSLN